MKELQQDNYHSIHCLLISRSFSEFGFAMYSITLPLIILRMTHSLSKSGIFFSILAIPVLLITPFTGVLVERVSRKALILICLLINTCVLGIQLAAYLTDIMRFNLLIFLAIIVAVIISLSDIATRVMFSELVPEKSLEKFNGIKSLIDNLSSFAAPMIGTTIYAFNGIKFVLTVVLGCLICAIFSLSKLRYCKQLSPKNDKINFFKDFKDGLTFIRSKKEVLKIAILAMSLNFFISGTDDIINPGILIKKYGISKSLFGLSQTMFILGVIFASWFVSHNKCINLHKKMPQLFVANGITMILIGLASIFMVLVPQMFFITFLFLESMVGFLTILVNIPLTSYFQSKVPINYQGRFFAFFSFTAQVSIPLGIGLTGVLAQQIGPDYAYIINNLLVICLVYFVFGANKH
ncbi:MFS transporter [Liquorilactobacillus capillatus]|uniref:Major facilitator superfamily (MFS) profile domain-containing protein n=1 Tax=Liquorilactobacillus capillatus DSM 19910 TaxID=1423731 RepID=A0A0R1LZ50_9LACO|nr:MFS transporter [Liquorilactobacillus capillatus]KRL00925.1 hypothetical protein FC81_GL001760 [Liquorilactobacillus capillatus DSM 19910]